MDHHVFASPKTLGFAKKGKTHSSLEEDVGFCPKKSHFEGKNECCGAWDSIEYFIFSALVHGPASYHQMC